MSRPSVSPESLHFEPAVLFFQAVRLDAHFKRQVSESSLFRLQLRVKRICDILISSLLMVICSPVLLAAFLAVRLSSRGPFIFSQIRWGLDQSQFRCYKMRTMFLDHDSQQSAHERSRGILHKPRNDPRVTAVGALLRKTSVDELPQLLNVLFGEMSLVGPRPLMVHMLEPFPEIREVRSIMRPGITGLWQIRNRAHNTSVLSMIADDAEYIARFSLLLDFEILLLTPWELIRGHGAH
jgi:lipopolysaccharide/colanic/teichoic acid biosynthesis glycosyltransferase